MKLVQMCTHNSVSRQSLGVFIRTETVVLSLHKQKESFVQLLSLTAVARLDSLATFSSRQSLTCLIVDLSHVWELHFWPDSRVCAWCSSLFAVCVCV